MAGAAGLIGLSIVGTVGGGVGGRAARPSGCERERAAHACGWSAWRARLLFDAFVIHAHTLAAAHQHPRRAGRAARGAGRAGCGGGSARWPPRSVTALLRTEGVLFAAALGVGADRAGPPFAETWPELSVGAGVGLAGRRGAC